VSHRGCRLRGGDVPADPPVQSQTSSVSVSLTQQQHTKRRAMTTVSINDNAPTPATKTVYVVQKAMTIVK